MKTILKVSAAGALALGAVGAHASISAPSSGTSDAILFAEVVNSAGTAVASYAGDTGVTISSLVTGLSTSKTVLSGDTNLANLFKADVTGDTLVWAVEGGTYTGATTAAHFGTAGVANFITTTTGDSTSNITNRTPTNLSKWATLNTDVTSLNTNLAGANSVEGASTVTAGLWDLNTPSGVSGWYSNGPTTGNVVGATQKLFYVTGAGSTLATLVPTNPGSETATLSSTGLVLAGGTAPVPLPAAVWLLGSGLLGLAGVGRRKSKA